MKTKPHDVVWICADQVSPFNTALRDRDPAHTTILMIESIERGGRVRYHKRKLALVYAAMRHFAKEQRKRGFTVAYFEEEPSFAAAFECFVKDARPASITIMEQSEYGETDRFRSLIEQAGVECTTTPLCNYVATQDEFSAAFGNAQRMTMEKFYRRMREKTKLLMRDGEPEGGRWNFDKENRKPPKQGLRPPKPPSFKPDATTRAVLEMVERRFADHPGSLENFDLPVTRAQALEALDDFVENRLDLFGPYEDAMVGGEPILYHSMLSSSINLGLLHPLECAKRAERAYHAGKARLESVEGFVRQLIGWREFIRGIYDRFMPEYRTRNALSADIPVPSFYWDAKTEMACIKDAVSSTLERGYVHHIQRLMVLANFGLIAGITPVELNDWFWAMYIDAYDWVMVPNVIGMSLHADGGIVGTKPYAASARYINTMSTYCKGCRYSPTATTGANACPFNSLYWDFLARHRDRFVKNTRMALVMRGLAARPAEWLAEVRAHASSIRKKLRAGEPL